MQISDIFENAAQTLIDCVPAGVCLCLAEEAMPILEANNGFEELLGYTAQTLQSLAETILPECRAHVREKLHELLGQGGVATGECRMKRRDGLTCGILFKVRVLKLGDGRRAYCCVLMDITEHVAAREALWKSLERHQIVMDQAMDIVFEWDIVQDTMLFSENWCKKMGEQPCSAIDAKQVFVSHVAAEDQEVLRRLMEDAMAGAPYAEGELRLRSADGELRWNRVRLTTQYDETGRPSTAVGAIVDIDADKRQRQSLMEQARRDSLTGLLNKETARREVEWRLGGKESGAGVMLAIDLDNFKQINDCCGHLCGDSVILSVAQILTGLFRANDIVARFGGDEFLVYLPGISREDAVRKARELVERLREASDHLSCGTITCSVGVAAFPEDAKNYRALYHCADIALYQAKKDGKNCVARYQADMSMEKSAPQEKDIAQ